MIDHNELLKRAAFNQLNKRWYVLAPAKEAQVSFPDFDPCRARHPIARVDWPAIFDFKEIVLTAFIFDGDSIPMSARPLLTGN